MKKIIKKIMPKSWWRQLRLLREAMKNWRIDRNYLSLIRKKGSPVVTPMDKHIISQLPREKFTSVLEVGCEGGRLLYWFAYHGYQTIGIEPNKRYRNLVNDFMKEQKMQNCRVVDGDIHNIQYPDTSFDIVISHAVLEHVQKPDIAVRELVRCTLRACIIAFPVGFECDSPGHIHHFSDKDVEELFKSFKYSRQIVYDRPGGNQVFLVTIRK